MNWTDRSVGFADGDSKAGTAEIVTGSVTEADPEDPVRSAGFEVES